MKNNNKKKTIYKNEQICNEGKSEFAVASFLSNAMLVVKEPGK